jgi:hypothetical protein
MSFVSDTIGKIGSAFSGGADKAAKAAAGIQAASGDKAIAFQRESRDIAREDLQPFREAGAAQLDPLTSLISDPQAQLDFIRNNPFFDALADKAQKRIFSNQAARGKVGSGGTAEALQNSLLLLGQDLLDRNVGQRMGLATMGQNAAAGQASVAQNTGANISNIVTDQGNARAAGEVGAANARAQGINNLVLGTAAGFQISDRRFKRDIERIGTLDNGIPWYRFRYEWESETRPGVMADEVERVNPEAVHTRPDGIKMVDYSRIGVPA